MNGIDMMQRRELGGDNSVVRATNGDIDAVWSLINADAEWLQKEKGLDHWSAYYTREVVEHKIRDQEVYITRDGGVATGTISLDQNPVEYYSEEDVLHFKDSTQPAIYVSALAVNPEFHGRGVASNLLGLAEREAVKRGISYIRFDCRAEYEDLVSFYEKRGYQRVGSFSEGEDQNYLLMEKELEKVAK